MNGMVTNQSRDLNLDMLYIEKLLCCISYYLSWLELTTEQKKVAT